MQINLGAGDQPMTKKIANGHEANAGAHQGSGKVCLMR
jgi:hypothetical protein